MPPYSPTIRAAYHAFMGDHEEQDKAWIALHADVEALIEAWELFASLFRHSNDRIGIWQWACPNFFAALHDVLRRDVFVHLRKLTEDAKAGRTLWNLGFEYFLDHLKLDECSDQYQQLKGKLDHLRTLVTRIAQHTNKTIVHSDSKVRLELEKLDPVELDEIQNAVRDAKELCDLLGHAKWGHAIGYDIHASFHVDKLHVLLEWATDHASKHPPEFRDALEAVRAKDEREHLLDRGRLA